MLTKTPKTEELAGTTVASVEEKGGAEAHAKKARRRVVRCGDWIRLGDAATDVVDGVGHAAPIRPRT